MKDLVQVDDNNNNKIDMNVIKNNGLNHGGSTTGAIIKATNGYAAKNGQKCSCDRGEDLFLMFFRVKWRFILFLINGPLIGMFETD